MEEIQICADADLCNVEREKNLGGSCLCRSGSVGRTTVVG